MVAGVTRLELAASCVTGKRSNQLNYTPEYHFTFGGRCKARTCDFNLVRVALYQLS